MKPLLELSTAQLEAIDDSGFEAEADGPSDATLYEQAYQVCSNAIQTGGSISEHIDGRLLHFLQERRMVEVIDDRVVLARDALIHGIVASNAKLERSVRGNHVRSTLEVQSDLEDHGWIFTDSLKTASIQNKVAMQENPSLYYELIVHHADSLLEYEQEGLFHHKQGESYYKTVELVITMGLDTFFEVPTYKNASFYSDLMDFLNGETDKDPREDPDKHKPKRTATCFDRMFLFSICLH